MKKLLSVSVTINLVFIALVLYLSINGKKHVRRLFIEKVIEVRHAQKLSMFEATPIAHGAIIFLGNSITEGANWGEFFPNSVMLNRGIGGDITSGVLSRMDEITRHQPSKLFICIGTNDIARNIEIPTIIENYSKIISVVSYQSPSTKIYIQSVLPVGRKVMYGHNLDSILKLNKKIKEICEEQNITYINIYDSLTDDDGYLDSRYTNDNLHLLGNAYLTWKKIISPYIVDQW